MESFRKYMEADMMEYNPCKNEKGHFADCDAGNLYSLTKKGASRMKAPQDKVKRGTLTSTGKVKAKFGQNSSRKKSCGRMTIDGDDIHPEFSCLKYPEKYQTEEKDDEKEEELVKRINSKLKNKKDGVPRAIDSRSVRLDKIGYPRELQALARGVVGYQEASGLHQPDLNHKEPVLTGADAAYMRAIIKDELMKALESNRTQKRGCSFQQILQGIQAIAMAENPPKAK